MALLLRALTAVAGRPEQIPRPLLEQFPELSGARYRRGGILPRLGGWCLGCASVAGITLGRTIWLGTRATPSAELLLHEIRHVHQFQAVRAFPLRYLLETLRRGYHHNRFEVDARRFAFERTRPHPEVTSSEGVPTWSSTPPPPS